MIGRLLIVGNRGGSHLAESLLRAAKVLGIAAELAAADEARSGLRLVNSLCWRLGDKQPPYMERFQRRLLKTVERLRPEAVITTGLSPVGRRALEGVRNRGVALLHYSTDDPWNPGQRARWHHAALGEYDLVFTPRRQNLADLQALTGGRARYLPFGYDPELARIEPGLLEEAPQALFVGGADADRAAFVREYLAAGAPLSLVGGYWERYGPAGAEMLGHRSPAEVASLTARAQVNLCLVRRANRDEHVMRSFEIPAIGGCMVAEDTSDHRRLFGAEGEAVLYFDSPRSAAEKVLRLLADPEACQRLARAAHARILTGAHSYADRLKAMLAEVAGSRAAEAPA